MIRKCDAFFTWPCISCDLLTKRYWISHVCDIPTIPRSMFLQVLYIPTIPRSMFLQVFYIWSTFQNKMIVISNKASSLYHSGCGGTNKAEEVVDRGVWRKRFVVEWGHLGGSTEARWGENWAFVSHLPLLAFQNIFPSHCNSFLKKISLTHIQASAYTAESVLQC